MYSLRQKKKKKMDTYIDFGLTVYLYLQITIMIDTSLPINDYPSFIESRETITGQPKVMLIKSYSLG